MSRKFHSRLNDRSGAAIAMYTRVFARGSPPENGTSAGDETGALPGVEVSACAAMRARGRVCHGTAVFLWAGVFVPQRATQAKSALRVC